MDSLLYAENASREWAIRIKLTEKARISLPKTVATAGDQIFSILAQLIVGALLQIYTEIILVYRLNLVKQN